MTIEIEMKTMLQQAKHEIISMRQRLSILEAREDVLETIAHVCGHRRNEPSRGMSDDIVWRIEKLLEHAAKADSSHPSPQGEP